MLTRIDVGHRDGQALDVQRVQRLVEHAAAGDAGGDAAQFDRHGDDDALVGRDAAEIDVQHVLAEVVPLHFLDDAASGAAVGLEIDDAGAVADGLDEVVVRQGERRRSPPCGRRRPPGAAPACAAAWSPASRQPSRGWTASCTDSAM